MTSTKFEVEKFNGANDFTLSQVKTKALLVNQDLAKTLEGREKLSDLRLRRMRSWIKHTVQYCYAWVMRFYEK